MKKYYENRLRQSRPNRSHIIRESIPVLFFGNIEKAKVATLGLNPSRVEFRDKKGPKFETLESLKISSLETANKTSLKKAYKSCLRYFRPENSYWKWFGQLELILNYCNASYLDGTACHLDLVQWATDPVWRGLKKPVRKKLILADGQFLKDQLKNEKIKLLLLNGKSVVENFQSLIDSSDQPIKKALGNGKKCNVWRFNYEKVQILGWSLNIQSSRGVSNEMRNAIGRGVKASYVR